MKRNFLKIFLVSLYMANMIRAQSPSTETDPTTTSNPLIDGTSAMNSTTRNYPIIVTFVPVTSNQSTNDPKSSQTSPIPASNTTSGGTATSSSQSSSTTKSSNDGNYVCNYVCTCAPGYYGGNCSTSAPPTISTPTVTSTLGPIPSQETSNKQDTTTTIRACVDFNTEFCQYFAKLNKCSNSFTVGITGQSMLVSCCVSCLSNNS